MNSRAFAARAATLISSSVQPGSPHRRLTSETYPTQERQSRELKHVKLCSLGEESVADWANHPSLAIERLSCPNEACWESWCRHGPGQQDLQAFPVPSSVLTLAITPFGSRSIVIRPVLRPAPSRLDRTLISAVWTQCCNGVDFLLEQSSGLVEVPFGPVIYSSLRRTSLRTDPHDNINSQTAEVAAVGGGKVAFRLGAGGCSICARAIRSFTRSTAPGPRRSTRFRAVPSIP